MSNNNPSYRFFNALNHPKRYLSLTLDEFSIAVLALFMLVIVSSPWLVVLSGMGSIAGLRFIKKSQPPNYLVILLYWYCPHALTQLFLPHLPPSHQRLWMA